MNTHEHTTNLTETETTQTQALDAPGVSPSETVQDAEATPTAVSDETRVVRTLRPAVDIFESDSGFLLQVELPGVVADDLSVDFEDGRIAVRGLRRLSRKGRDGAGLAVAFERAFQLPKTVDSEGITAQLTAGLLTLELPRSAAARSRQIPVSAG